MDKMIISRKFLIDKIDVGLCIFIGFLYMTFFLTIYFKTFNITTGFIEASMVLILGLFHAWFMATVIQYNLNRRKRMHFKKILNPKFWIWRGYAINLGNNYPPAIHIMEHVHEWCQENVSVYCFDESSIIFKTKSDALKFILRWAGS